jgi:hypothetical protein
VTEAELEREFVSASLRRHAYYADGKIKKANSEVDYIRELQPIRALPDRGEAMLKRITQHDDVGTKVAAAAYLLPVDERYAIAVLSGIAKGGFRMHSVTAHYAIREWRAGKLREYYKQR